MKPERILVTAAIAALALLVLACAVFVIIATFASGVGAQERPALYVVPARDTVMPGDVFSVTVTAFGDVGPVQFDSGGLTVLTDTATLPTRYITMRASGPARDVRVRAWGSGMEASSVIRVCCRAAPDARGTRRVWVPLTRR